MKRNKLTKLAGVVAAAAMVFSSLTVSAAEENVYTTQKGDSLGKIAQKFYGDRTRWKEIYDANTDVLANPFILMENLQLVIPGGDATVQQPVPQDTPAELSSSDEQPVLQDTPELPSSAELQTAATGWPASAEWQTAVALGGPSYVEQNGLQFYQGTSCKVEGYRSTTKYPSTKEPMEVDESITGITISDAEKEGYQVVTISTERTGSIAQYSGGEQRFLGTSMSIPTVCDIYTGKILNFAVMWPDGYLEDMVINDLEWGGMPYSIDGIRKDEWIDGEWSEWDATGSCYALETGVSTYSITIPKGYDGLAILITPSGRVGMPDPERYIMDDWLDGSYLMRVSDLYDILNGR